MADRSVDVSVKSVIDTVTRRFALDQRSPHGPAHWMRVRANGLMLASITGADKRVVEYFALLHDSCRLNDWEDPEHGSRAAEFATQLFDEGVFVDLSTRQLHQLVTACRGHTFEGSHDDITVATCWDADRLDLPRVGISVDSSRLATDEARGSGLIEWADQRARAWCSRIYGQHWIALNMSGNYPKCE